MLIRKILSSDQRVILIALLQKKFKTHRAVTFTRHGWFRLASIDQYSSLLPPVGVWTVSQFQCGGPSSQNPYPSSVWWAVTPPHWFKSNMVYKKNNSVIK